MANTNKSGSGKTTAESNSMLAAAMQLVGNRLAILTNAAITVPAKIATGNTGGRYGNEGKLGIAGTLLTGLITKIAVAIAPLAVLGAVIGSSTSGFSVFLSSIKMAGMLLGGLLAPVFIGLAAGVYAATESLASVLLPMLETYDDTIIGLFIEAVEEGERQLREFIKACVEFYDWVRSVIDATGEQKKAVEETASSPFKSLTTAFLSGLESVGIDPIQTIGEATGSSQEEIDAGKRRFLESQKLLGVAAGGKTEGERLREKAAAAAAAAGKPGKPGDPAAKSDTPTVDRLKDLRDKLGKDKGFGDLFKEGLRASLGEFRKNNTPQAQSLSIAQVSRQAQMAALNVSPYEVKQLEYQAKILAALEKSIGKLAPAVAP